MVGHELILVYTVTALSIYDLDPSLGKSFLDCFEGGAVFADH